MTKKEIDKRCVEIAEHIFYLPATNNKAGQSISEGAKMISDFALKIRAEAFKEVLIKFRLTTTAQVKMWLSNSISLMSFNFGKEEQK